MTELDAARRFYAEEIAAVAIAELPPALVEALARVPRERFLGPGPWLIMRDGSRPGAAAYRRTPDADPRHLYHNVLVAIDAERQLNNGQPSGNAIWIAAVEVRPGDRVVHIGAGVGYYTAILAELTGSSGSVTAIEIDAALAERARQNLADHPWVTVLCGDGSAIPEADAIYVNAGCTHPRAEWLAALSDGGRLVLPITAHMPDGTGGPGFELQLRRQGTAWLASAVSPVAIFDCHGARDAEEDRQLLELARRKGYRPLETVRRLRRDAHDEDPSCVIHLQRYCLSTGEA